MKRNLESIKEMIQAKIVYYRKLQDKASVSGNPETAERFKFYRWELEDLLEALESTKSFRIDYNYYCLAAKEAL